MAAQITVSKERGSPFIEFLESLRAAATRRNYANGIRDAVQDPDGFLRLGRQDRRAAEERLIEFIKGERQRGVAPATVRNPVNAVKSFLDYHEVLLNWHRIRGLLPAARKVARDRPPTLEELRALLAVCDLRMRLVVLIMASSGMRIGGFAGLCLRHLVPLSDGTPRLRIYEGAAEEYWAFISPEADGALHEYLAAREAVGERLAPDAPLIRDKWQFENRRTRLDPAVAKPMTPKALANILQQLWVKARVRKPRAPGTKYRRHAFQAEHGLRKWFETQASRGIRDRTDVEVLMGSLKSYHKPSEEYLAQEYRKALPYLTITEAEEAKQALAQKEAQHREEFRDLRLLVYEKDQQVQQIREQMAALQTQVQQLVASKAVDFARGQHARHRFPTPAKLEAMMQDPEFRARVKQWQDNFQPAVEKPADKASS